MLAFVWWIIIGLIAGLLARFIVPGAQPMTWLMTIVLGLVGSLVGGFISSAIYGTDPRAADVHTAGLLMSTVGAVIALILYLAYEKRGPNRL